MKKSRHRSAVLPLMEQLSTLSESQRTAMVTELERRMDQLMANATRVINQAEQISLQSHRPSALETQALLSRLALHRDQDPTNGPEIPSRRR